ADSSHGDHPWSKWGSGRKLLQIDGNPPPVDVTPAVSPARRQRRGTDNPPVSRQDLCKPWRVGFPTPNPGFRPCRMHVRRTQRVSRKTRSVRVLRLPIREEMRVNEFVDQRLVA